MIQERIFDGFIFDHMKDAVQQVNNALKVYKPQVVYPGTYDITPSDRRFTRYESQTLHVFSNGHGAVVGRRRFSSTTEEPSLIHNETLQKIAIPSIPVFDDANSLIALLGEGASDKFNLFTMDADYFLLTRQKRLRLWRILAYHPGNYLEDE